MAAVTNCLDPRRFGVSVEKIEDVPIKRGMDVTAFELVMHDERSRVNAHSTSGVHFEFAGYDPAQGGQCPAHQFGPFCRNAT